MIPYEIIFKRRQVREFNSEPLDQAVLDDVVEFANSVKQLEGQNVRFKLVGANDMSNPNSAPYYLVSYCDDNYFAYINAGYVMEEVNLYMQSKGIASGFFYDLSEKEPEGNSSITLVFGNADVPMRESEEEFDRLPLSEISNSDNEVARAIRLSPSAHNAQPWNLEFSDGKVVIKEIDRGDPTLMMGLMMHKFSIGLATRHAVFALNHEGKTVAEITPEIFEETKVKVSISFS